ncbi:MAG: SRPBCC family protein [Pseudolabrys sp.]|nr:SRPBCC family protein [Pseudolabrys sp.]
MLSPQRTALACCLLIAAGSCLNAARAAAGDPIVQVETDEAANATHVRASIDIAAAPLVVWNVLTDCARMPEIFPNLESCRIVKRDPAGKWDVRENVIDWAVLMPKLRTMVRNTFDIGRRLTFRRIGGDMRVSDGEWKLAPHAQGTRLSYNALVAPDFPVPQFMIEQAVHTDMPNLLRAIQKASVADAGKK